MALALNMHESIMMADIFNFVKSCRLEFIKADSPNQRDRVLTRYCKDLVRHGRNNADDASALVMLADAYAIRMTGKEWQRFRKLYKNSQDDRKQALQKKVVLLWGLELAEHYGWLKDSSRAFLQKLQVVAKRYPRWQLFVKHANMTLIIRHEASVHSAAKDKIGNFRPGTLKADRMAPLQTQDLVNMMKEDFEMQQNEERVEAWLHPCRCLSIAGQELSNDRYKHYAITQDRFGLLIPSDNSDRTETCNRCHPQRAQVGGLRLPSQGSSVGEECCRSTPSIDASINAAILGAVDSPSSFSESVMGTEQRLCEECRSCCRKCVVPDATTDDDAHQMHLAAHVLGFVASKDEWFASLLDPIRFASSRPIDSDGECDVQVSSWKTFKRIATGPRQLLTPIVVKERLLDQGDYKYKEVLRALRNTYASTGILTIDPRSGQISMTPVDFLESILQGSESQKRSIMIADLLQCDESKVLRTTRFNVFDVVLKRIKSKRVSGQLPGADISLETGSCSSYSAIGRSGAVTVLQQFLPGGTWLRLLTGSAMVWTVADNISQGEADHQAMWANGRATYIHLGQTMLVPLGFRCLVLNTEPVILNSGVFWDGTELDRISRLLRSGSSSYCGSNSMIMALLATEVDEIIQESSQAPPT